MYHIYQKLNITALQNCLNWCFANSQTYLVAQIRVEQISLNFADEINSLKLKNFKFRANRSIFVRTERPNTIVEENLLVSPNQSFKINFSHSVEGEND